MRTTRLALVTTATLLAGCAALPRTPAASASLESRSGSAVTGKVGFTERTGTVRAHVELHGLAPGSEHGLHVHDKGDCSAPDATSAGGHFNPAGVAHGRAGGGVHHAGDAPSVVADAHGEVRADLVLDGVTLQPRPLSIVGRAVVVHRDRDDYTAQPAGNAGPRVACGVISGG
jgi:Cu-Zn family superoxide dismutase